MDVFDIKPPILAGATGLPTFRVNSVMRSDLGNGDASIINCWQHDGLITPLCRIVIAAPHMITIGKSANAFALEMHRRLLVSKLHALRIDGSHH